MENILWFEKIKKSNINLVGGKGANLGEMFFNFPIPNGFCVTTIAYKSFLEENKIIKKINSLVNSLDINDTTELDNVSKKLRNMIMFSKFSNSLSNEIISSYNKIKGYVAVRSSATAEDLEEASFAGQQDTYLNIKGNIDLLDAIKRCFASLYTSRAIYYRVTNNFKHEDVLISVVVQQMVQSKVAGVMFTANPINKSKDEMVIEGSYGLGEMIVSGMVTPDTFMLKKSPLSIYNKFIGEKNKMMKKEESKNKIIEVPSDKKLKPSISDENVIKLAEIGLKIENHYKKPMDIEWAFDDDGKLFILQARPITTL